MRRPRATLALVATIVTASVVFSGGVGDGALPTASLPAFGVTAGNGSLSTVAELGDINGDGFGDYAIGMPSADVGTSADAGTVYVFLGRAGALPPAPTSLDPATATFQITGRGSEMLGYAIVGNDVNRDGLSDIAIGAPMAGAPSKAGGGAVYVVFGSRTPASLSTNALSFAGYTNAPTSPATPSPLGSRYDGFQQNGHTGMSLAALPDVNGDGYRDLAVGAPDASLHTPGGGGVAVLYGKPLGVHITLNDLWENGYPYSFHIDYPAIANQHVGMSVASVGDMTGDGWPDIAVGAPQADPGGRIDAGSVWIINGHLPPIVGCTKASPAGVCPWIKLRSLSAAQGYRIDGPVAGAQLGSSLAGIGDQNADGLGDLAIGQAGASPLGRARARRRRRRARAAQRGDARPRGDRTAADDHRARGRRGARLLARRGGQWHGDRRARRLVLRRRRLHGARRSRHHRSRAGGEDRTGSGRIDGGQRGRSRLVARRRRRRRADRSAGRERLGRLVRRRRLKPPHAPP